MMQSLKPALKVHIVVVGTEVDRVVQPLAEQRADRVYILYDKGADDITAHYLKKIKKGIRQACPQLPKDEIITDTYEKWADLSALMAKIAEVVRTEQGQGNQVYVNISSGGKLSAVAGTVVSLMYGATAYYARPEHYLTRERKETASKGYAGSIVLPTYSIEPPPEELLHVMAVIRRFDRAAQKAVVRELVREGRLRAVEEKNGRELNPNALYALFRRKCLTPLLERGWVEKEGQRRNATLRLTREGENTLRTFGT